MNKKDNRQVTKHLSVEFGIFLQKINQIRPCAIIASATFWKPAILAPATRS